MRCVPRIALAAALLLSVVAAATAAGATAPLRLTATGGALFPDRSYLLGLPAPRSLTPSDVKVSENGLPVGGVSLVREGSSNRSRSAVVVAIDDSLTMKGRPLADAYAAARAFAVHANRDEEVAIVLFDGSVSVLQPFTYSASAVAAALSHEPAVHYGTKVYDALAESLKLISAAGASSGSIIVLTDGQNVGSVAKPAVVLRALAAAHARVFSVGLVSPAFDPASLERWAQRTGGSYIEATSVSRLTPILAGIGARLSDETCSHTVRSPIRGRR